MEGGRTKRWRRRKGGKYSTLTKRGRDKSSWEAYWEICSTNQSGHDQGVYFNRYYFSGQIGLGCKHSVLLRVHVYELGLQDNKQLLDEVEHDIMNYQNRGLCYLPKPKAEADNTDTRFW